jgi:hypothetical protein
MADLAAVFVVCAPAGTAASDINASAIPAALVLETNRCCISNYPMSKLSASLGQYRSGVLRRTISIVIIIKLEGSNAMRILFTRANLLTAAVLLTAAAAVVSLAAGVPAAVHYIGHDKVKLFWRNGGKPVRLNTTTIPTTCS